MQVRAFERYILLKQTKTCLPFLTYTVILSVVCNIHIYFLGNFYQAWRLNSSKISKYEMLSYFLELDIYLLNFITVCFRFIVT